MLALVQAKWEGGQSICIDKIDKGTTALLRVKDRLNIHTQYIP